MFTTVFLGGLNLCLSLKLMSYEYEEMIKVSLWWVTVTPFCSQSWILNSESKPFYFKIYFKIDDTDPTKNRSLLHFWYFEAVLKPEVSFLSAICLHKVSFISTHTQIVPPAQQWFWMRTSYKCIAINWCFFSGLQMFALWRCCGRRQPICEAVMAEWWGCWGGWGGPCVGSNSAHSITLTYYTSELYIKLTT